VFFVAIANAELVQQQLELTFFSPWQFFIVTGGLADTKRLRPAPPKRRN
jgi:hypothetical protein